MVISRNILGIDVTLVPQYNDDSNLPYANRLGSVRMGDRLYIRVYGSITDLKDKAWRIKWQYAIRTACNEEEVRNAFFPGEEVFPKRFNPSISLKNKGWLANDGAVVNTPSDDVVQAISSIKK